MPSSIAVATTGDDPADAYVLLPELRHGARRAGHRAARRRDAIARLLRTASGTAFPIPPTLPPRPDPGRGRPLRRRGRPLRRRQVRRRSGRARANRGGRPARRRPLRRRASASGASCRGRVKQLSRIRFATIGPSNHFIELQEVEEVLDPEAAALLGVERGQVTLQYHGGGGSLPGELGAALRPPQALPAGRARPDGASRSRSTTSAGARSLEEFKLRQAAVLLRRLPAGRARRRRGRAADAGQRDGDELRLRVQALGLRDPDRSWLRDSFGARAAAPGRRLAAQLDLRGGDRRAHRRSCTATTPRVRTRPRR